VTTVVAVARGGVVHMAADSVVTVFDRPVIGAAQKIRRFRAVRGGEVLLGLSGDGAIMGVVAAGWTLDSVPAAGDDVQAWAHACAAAITKLATEAGCVDNDKMDANMILGWSGRVWTLAHSLAIEHPDGIAAIGSGEGPAIGAVDALLMVGRYPADAVRLAADIAVRRDTYSGGPMQVERLTAEQSGGGESDGDEPTGAAQ
jgi:ATP-dependent protease HslVU (ClpYQ) peptidase subunit